MKYYFYNPNNHQWLYFTERVEVVQVNPQNFSQQSAINHQHFTDVAQALEYIDQRVQQHNLYAAGFISYEAGSYLNPHCVTKSAQNSPYPLLHFGIFRQINTLSQLPTSDYDTLPTIQWHSQLTEEAFKKKIEHIQNYILAGDTYQVNFTFPLQGKSTQTIDFWQWFLSLVSYEVPSYAAFIDTDEHIISSLSPECFFTLEGNTISSKPMKGTHSRGLTQKNDLQHEHWLQHSDKNKAENLMILDMVRNDLTKIADTNRVSVSKLFILEKYATVWQMVSEVNAQTNASIVEIFKALFPAASITGAPKYRTMEIIHECESTVRNIYTGSLGYLLPNRQAQFNVAIRTIQQHQASDTIDYHVGAGITLDSKACQEYQECLLKSHAVQHPIVNFQLVETLLIENQKPLLLDLHLNRIQQSADYFNIPLTINKLKQQLQQTIENTTIATAKLRLLVNKQGHIEIQISELTALPEQQEIQFARYPVNRSDVFLYHKTTERNCYLKAQRDVQNNQNHQNHQNNGGSQSSVLNEVIFYNEQDEITESNIANIVIEQQGEWFTPPIKSGLLGGVYRQHLLNTGKVKEKIIYRQELQAGQTIYLINSVRRCYQRILKI